MDLLGSPFSSGEDDGGSTPSDFFTMSPRNAKGKKKKKGDNKSSSKSRRGPPKILSKSRANFAKLVEQRHNKVINLVMIMAIINRTHRFLSCL